MNQRARLEKCWSETRFNGSDQTEAVVYLVGRRASFQALAIPRMARPIPKFMFLSYIRELVKSIAFQTPAARYLGPRYPYNFRPGQLAFLVSMLDEVKEVGGSIVEVGCFSGATTIFLSEHLRDQGRPCRYIAIDTFTGFLEADVAHELTERGKSSDRELYASAFVLNRRSWVRRSLDLSGHSGVDLVEADAGNLDFRQFAPIAFALIDVDLYRPVARSLRAIAPFMSRGGRIVVDDCRPGQAYDGALDAYTEWCEDSRRPLEIVHGKLGVIRF